jgi:hypothetical protein
VSGVHHILDQRVIAVLQVTGHPGALSRGQHKARRRGGSDQEGEGRCGTQCIYGMPMGGETRRIASRGAPHRCT